SAAAGKARMVRVRVTKSGSRAERKRGRESNLPAPPLLSGRKRLIHQQKQPEAQSRSNHEQGPRPVEVEARHGDSAYIQQAACRASRADEQGNDESQRRPQHDRLQKREHGTPSSACVTPPDASVTARAG